MKDFRFCIVTPEEQENFNPAIFVERMKAAGFKLDNDTCPVKITKPWQIIETPLGVLYVQWDET